MHGRAGWISALRYGVLAVTALVALAHPARALDRTEMAALADEATAAFQEGNRLAATDPTAAQAHYERATLRLEHLIRDGGVENGKLYYNLGNIWYQRGDLGRSILNYRRAEQYIPNNVNLRQNLSFVRQQRKDAFAPAERQKVLSTIFFWHYDLASGTRLWLFALTFTAFWGLAAVRLYWRRGVLNGMLAAFGLLAAVLFVSLTVEAWHVRIHPAGVIIAAETVARKGDGETYQPSFAEPLHAGTEFTMLEDRGAWVQVALPDDRTCWLSRADVGLVRERPGEATPP